MVYALLVLLAVGFVSKISLRHFGLIEDASTHFYGSFQNALYAKTLYQVAKACLSRYEMQVCDNQDFNEGIYKGGYELFDDKDSYRVEIWVLHQNPRNLHIIRSFLVKKIKKVQNATP